MRFRLQPKPQRRSASEWRRLFAASISLTLLSLASIALDLRVFAAITSMGAALSAFVTGYLYRADIVRTGRRPPSFLVVETDDTEQPA